MIRALRSPELGWPWLGLALVLLAQLAADRWALSTNAVNVDYFTLWSVPRTLPSLSGRNIYTPDTQREMATLLRTRAATWASPAERRSLAVSDQLYGGRVDATATPFAYAIVGLTSTGDYDRDLGRYRFASCAAFIGAIVLLGLLLRFTAPLIVTAVVVLSLAFAPLLAELRVANINQFQLLALAGCLWLLSRDRPAAAGLVIGAAILFKPTLALVPLALAGLAVADGRLRLVGLFAAGTAAGMAAAAVSGAWYFADAGVWLRFAESLRRTLATGYPLANGNFGLAALARSEWGADVSLVALAVVSSAFATVLWRTRRSRLAAEAAGPPATTGWIAAAGIGCAAMLLTSRLVWLHYFLLLVPLALLLLRPDAAAPVSRRYAGVAAAILSLLLLSPVAQSMAGDAASVALLANVATLLLVGATLDDLRRTRRATPAPAPVGVAARRGRSGRRAPLGRSSG